MINIPGEDRKLIQTNKSDTLGNILSSFNLDLVENLGNIRLGSRTLLNLNSVDDTDLGVPVGFKYFTGAATNIWAAAGSYMWKNSGLPSDTFAQDATSGTPTDLSSDVTDMEVFLNDLYVSGTGTVLNYLRGDTGAWATVTSFGSSGSSTAKGLCVFGSRLYMVNQGATVISINAARATATSGQYTLSLGNTDSNIITSLRASASRIWVCTLNTRGGNGYIYEWDGSSSQPTKSYRLESSGALACVIKDDIPYVIDTSGSLLVWNGGSFKIIATFKTDPRLFKNALTAKNNRWIHPNGMSIVRNRINILINTQLDSNGSPMLENCPSGIWEYDENIGLYHKYSIALAKSGDTITDYGAERISQAGALQEVNIPSTGSSRNGTFVAGVAYFTDATTAKNGIFYDDSNETKQKAGYIVTTKLQSSQVADMWQKFWLRYKKFLDSADKVVAKYRIDNPAPVEGTITWTATNTFTVPNSSVVVSNYWASGTGKEVQVIRGVGAGRCAHITNAVLAAGTWIVTVDETFTGATSGTATARFQNWTKLGSISDQTSQYKEFGIPMGVNNPWIEFKVWMLFTGDTELNQLIAQSIPFILAQSTPPTLLKQNK